ncbi:MAG: AGE family epimerase/isomerase, partial [Thermomicrobiales bacterium]
MTQSGSVIDDPRRTRLVARQTYVFATGAEIGWSETQRARELVHHGLDFLLNKCATDAGLAYAAVSPTGEPIDHEFHLYDHAFFLFALGVSARLGYRRAAATDVGEQMLHEMVRLRKHPKAGFEESVPPSKQLNANPHMHLLEACLEWEATDVDGLWRAMSDEIAELALNQLIDTGSGCLRE